MRNLSFLIVLIVAGCGNQPTLVIPTTKAEHIHPLFRTPISAVNPTRLAVQVDILDAKESWFTTAELYLAVHSSRSPDSTWVVLPLNRGDFDGATKRFIQLPFEIREDDTVVFNLLDEDSLSDEDELAVLEACNAAGYCLFHAGRVYQPVLATIAKPALDATADAVARVVIDECDLHEFDNYGDAEFIVPRSLPRVPTLANKLTLLDDKRYARVQLRIYGSDDSFSADGP